jgi:hypothetical protein
LAIPDLYTIENDRQDHLFTYSEVEYLKGGSYTFEQVLQPGIQNQFRKSASYIPQTTHLNEMIWIKLRIKGNSGSDKKWLL